MYGNYDSGCDGGALAVADHDFSGDIPAVYDCCQSFLFAGCAEPRAYDVYVVNEYCNMPNFFVAFLGNYGLHHEYGRMV
jgi:hypothetical protein